jgi:hypothetical protein
VPIAESWVPLAPRASGLPQLRASLGAAALAPTSHPSPPLPTHHPPTRRTTAHDRRLDRGHCGTHRHVPGRHHQDAHAGAEPSRPAGAAAAPGRTVPRCWAEDCAGFRPSEAQPNFVGSWRRGVAARGAGSRGLRVAVREGGWAAFWRLSTDQATHRAPPHPTPPSCRRSCTRRRSRRCARSCGGRASQGCTAVLLRWREELGACWAVWQGRLVDSEAAVAQAVPYKLNRAVLVRIVTPRYLRSQKSNGRTVRPPPHRPAHALYFSTYEAAKNLLGGNREGHHPVAAASAGAAATLVNDAAMTPVDVVKQRLQVGAGPRLLRGSVWHGARVPWRPGWALLRASKCCNVPS